MTTAAPSLQLEKAIRRQYLRPLWLAILVSMAGEGLIFLIFGLLLNGAANWPAKLVWTVGFCGVGMGSGVGAFVDLFVVGRLSGARAILATCGISTALLGVACNLLCWRLDLGLHFFGGAEHPLVFLGSGILGAVSVGLGLGLLLFTKPGQHWLEQRGW